MPANPNEEELLKQARFVFKGTVQQPRAANVSGVNKNRAAIVLVDEVVQAPEDLGDYTGQEVTVALGEGEKLKAGQRAVFYTNPTIFEEHTGVASVGHRDMEGPALALSANFAEPAVNLAKQQVKERLETADMVVTGRVASIRLPEDAAPLGGAVMGLAAAPDAPESGRRRPISEHDPHWREAVIEVANVEKGEHARKEVVIRFPDSNDVRWYKAPKFRPGQKGVFILHKTQSARPAEGPPLAATLTETEAETTEAFTALHPADFQPLQQHPEVQTLIKGIAASAKKGSGPDEG